MKQSPKNNSASWCKCKMLKSLKILENNIQKYILLLFVTIGHTHARKQNHWIRQENSQWNDAYMKCTQVRLVVKLVFLEIQFASYSNMTNFFK